MTSESLHSTQKWHKIQRKTEVRDSTEIWLFDVPAQSLEEEASK